MQCYDSVEFWSVCFDAVQYRAWFLRKYGVCFQCEEIGGEQRRLCVHCRDDRVRCLHPGKVRCLPGFCPAKERADHGNDWGLGFTRPRHWMLSWGYDAVRKTERQRIFDVTSSEHGGPTRPALCVNRARLQGRQESVATCKH